MHQYNKKKPINIIKGKHNVFTQGCQNWEIIYLNNTAASTRHSLSSYLVDQHPNYIGLSRACKLILVGTCTGNPGECCMQP